MVVSGGSVEPSSVKNQPELSSSCPHTHTPAEGMSSLFATMPTAHVRAHLAHVRWEFETPGLCVSSTPRETETAFPLTF